AETADLVLTGASVVTLDPARPRATAIAVRGGRILRVGSDAEVQALAGPRTRRLALAGRADVLERVRRAAAALPPGEWLEGRGWDQNDWTEKRFPTAADLDRAARDRP